MVYVSFKPVWLQAARSSASAQADQDPASGQRQCETKSHICRERETERQKEMRTNSASTKTTKHNTTNHELKAKKVDAPDASTKKQKKTQNTTEHKH